MRAWWSSAARSFSSDGTSSSLNFPDPSVGYVYAFIERRSTTPRKPASVPRGICMGMAPGCRLFRRSPSVRKRSARSRSILLTKKATGRLYSSAYPHTFSVWTLTPSTALTRIRATSATRMQIRVSVRKLEKPGVSIRLNFTPFHSVKATAALMLIPRLISSSSKSVVVFPSSTRPRRVSTPVLKRIASVKEVLPSCP